MTANKRRFVMIEASVYTTPAFRTLPSAATKLYVDLRTQHNGYNNGRIVCTLSRLRERGWVSDGTLTRALWTLLERGLLIRTREGKPGPFRTCAYYAFADLPVVKAETQGIRGANPTQEYLSWVDGKSFAPESKARKISPNRRCKESVPLPNRGQSSSETRNDTAANDEVLMPIGAARTAAGKSPSKRRKSAPVVDFRAISD